MSCHCHLSGNVVTEVVFIPVLKRHGIFMPFYDKGVYPDRSITTIKLGIIALCKIMRSAAQCVFNDIPYRKELCAYIKSHNHNKTAIGTHSHVLCIETIKLQLVQTKVAMHHNCLHALTQ